MIHSIGAWTKSVGRGALAVSIALAASQAMAQAVTGTVTDRERMALPPGAAFDAAIEDVPAQTPSAHTTPAFEGTYWKAVQLEGKPVPANNSVREAHLVFESGRASGSDGCNRVSGNYHQTDPDVLTFDEMLSTQMSCAGTGETERAFRSVVKDTRHWRIDNGHLELLDANSARLAIFDAEARR